MGDELESVMWALLHGALQNFDGDIDACMNNFSYYTGKPGERTDGIREGSEKGLFLWSEGHKCLAFTCEPLSAIICDFTSAWATWYRWRDDPDPDDFPVLAEQERKYSKPSFWLTKIKAVTSREDWEEGDVTPFEDELEQDEATSVRMLTFPPSPSGEGTQHASKADRVPVSGDKEEEKATEADDVEAEGEGKETASKATGGQVSEAKAKEEATNVDDVRTSEDNGKVKATRADGVQATSEKTREGTTEADGAQEAEEPVAPLRSRQRKAVGVEENQRTKASTSRIKRAATKNNEDKTKEGSSQRRTRSQTKQAMLASKHPMQLRSRTTKGGGSK